MPHALKKLGKAFEQLVGFIFNAFHPEADVCVGEWIQGPDGRREVDVTVRGTFQGEERFAIIECKDYSDSTGPVGISHVDAFESKRRDLGAHAAIICSNSGFTEGALSKGARCGIGMVSIAKAGDPNARAEFVVTHLARAITFGEWRFQLQIDGQKCERIVDYLHEGKPVVAWLVNQVILQTVQNPRIASPVRYNPVIARPIGLGPNVEGYVTGMSVEVDIRVDWYEIDTKIDAEIGIYDWLKGKLLLPPGATGFHLNVPISTSSGGRRRMSSIPSDVDLERMAGFEGGYFVFIEVTGVFPGDNPNSARLDFGAESIPNLARYILD